MVANTTYTANLQAGLGLIDETRTLLDLWQTGMSAPRLQRVALESGLFPTISARRLRNLITECFAQRYLIANGAPARLLQQLQHSISTPDLIQFMFLFTCRANPILGDFVRQIYWPKYAGGYSRIANSDARAFVERGIEDGLTIKRWSETTVRRVSAYLTGCCADFGLLEKGARSVRQIQSYRILPVVAAYLAYELHFAGLGDNAILVHRDWQLFGLAREDVLDELKRLSLKSLLIVQAAGEIVRVSWRYHDMEALADVLAQG